MKNKINLSDVLVFAGSALFTYGLWRIYPPAAYMALGSWMVTLGMMGNK